MNDKDLAEIDKLDQPGIPNRSQTLSFTTANNKKSLVTCNRQSTMPYTLKKKKPPDHKVFKEIRQTPSKSK